MGSIVSAKRGRRKDVFSAEGSEVAEQDHDKTEGKGHAALLPVLGCDAGFGYQATCREVMLPFNRAG